MMRLTIRLVLILFIILVFVLPFYFTWATKAKHANSVLVKTAFRLGCIVLGLKVSIQGTLPDKTPLLIISNHFSYLDVFALGSLLPVRFTPKSEVASWPAIGFLSKINGCIFIDRRPSQTKRNKETLDQAIKDGDIISLFPESTTSDGTKLLPFKSSFFSIAENRDLTVQPVSIFYTKLNGNPLTIENRHIIGWYSDMEFFPHFIALMRQSSIEVTLVFHSPVNGKDFASRKELKDYCQHIIDAAVPKY